MAKLDRPVSILIKEVLPIELFADLRKRLFKPAWSEFFNSLFSIGLIFVLCSFFGLGILLFVLSTFSGKNGIVNTVWSLVQNISLLSVGLYAFSIIVLEAVEASNTGTLIFEDLQGDWMKKIGENWFFRMALDAFSGATSVLLILLTWVFRTHLIISDIPVVHGVTDFDALGAVSLIFFLDLAYLGLVLATTGQIYQIYQSTKQRNSSTSEAHSASSEPHT